MGSFQSIQHLQVISQQITFLQNYLEDLPQQKQEQIKTILERMIIAVSNLQLSYEEMLSILEASEIVEEDLLIQHRQVIASYEHYYKLFQFSPIASCVTDAQGVIIEANPAFCELLNISPCYLVGKPLAIYISPEYRSTFRTQLNQIIQFREAQTWKMAICPRKKEQFIAELKMVVIRDESDQVESLLLSIHDLTQYKQENSSNSTKIPELPHALDGLQVLVVDDEADAREFISAVLESQGVNVTAVDSADEALKSIEQSCPNVLVSDLRMPEQDGYSLIQKVRALETEKGYHIPAAAITAYLVEDSEKALAAGFESYLHKLAQPSDLVKMVARLSGRKLID